MKSEELRIGEFRYKNLISYKGVPYEINNIHGASGLIHVLPQVGMNNPNTISMHDFERIPLTEEWLVKFGFVYDEYGKLFHNKIALYKYADGPFTYNVNYFEHDCLEEVKYVHQLQNLYFALTGGELQL